MTSGQHVVIVDGMPETAAVLREVFEPRGHRVERVRSFDSTTTSSKDRVLVVHDDLRSDAERQFRYGTTPRVIIGSVTNDAKSGDDAQDHESRLAHPFHYAELIRAVEALLDESRPQRSAA